MIQLDVTARWFELLEALGMSKSWIDMANGFYGTTLITKRTIKRIYGRHHKFVTRTGR
jgi:hypothetical protein